LKPTPNTWGSEGAHVGGGDIHNEEGWGRHCIKFEMLLTKNAMIRNQFGEVRDILLYFCAKEP
jgi:hypothetical protein